MAQESVNLDKEEAEILKPSSSSSSSPPPPPPSASPPSLFLKPSQEFPIQRTEKPQSPASGIAIAVEESQPSLRLGNRCSSCRKRVGLTAFRCRCGDLFCARHRYSDTHDCSFDYKAAAREEISKSNPVIRAAKIIKI